MVARPHKIFGNNCVQIVEASKWLPSRIEFGKTTSTLRLLMQTRTFFEDYAGIIDRIRSKGFRLRDGVLRKY